MLCSMTGMCNIYATNTCIACISFVDGLSIFFYSVLCYFSNNILMQDIRKDPNPVCVTYTIRYVTNIYDGHVHTFYYFMLFNKYTHTCIPIYMTTYMSCMITLNFC